MLGPWSDFHTRFGIFLSCQVISRELHDNTLCINIKVIYRPYLKYLDFNYLKKNKNYIMYFDVTFIMFYSSIFFIAFFYKFI